MRKGAGGEEERTEERELEGGQRRRGGMGFNEGG